MPFRSKAQAGYLHSHPGILGASGLKEWDAASKGKHLPEHAPKMHEGGTVPADGKYELKKGEKVTPVAKEKAEEKHEAKHGFSHSTIRHFKDGSHSIHHHHATDKSKDVKHAVASDDGMHDSLHEHVGMPNPGEAEANAGQSGIPGESVASAPAPAAAAPVAGQAGA